MNLETLNIEVADRQNVMWIFGLLLSYKGVIRCSMPGQCVLHIELVGLI